MARTGRFGCTWLLCVLLAWPAAAQTAATLSATAIAAIADDPARLDQAVAAAVAAAPDQADAIVAGISRAFPYHAQAIARAAGRPVSAAAYAPVLPPAPVPSTSYRAPPADDGSGAVAARAVAAIAANPAELEHIVAAAVAAAPQRRQQIAAEIGRAYPLFAGRVQAAADGAPAAAAQAMPPAAPAVAAAPAAADDDPFARAEAHMEAEFGSLAPPGQEEISDPLEDVNRVILTVNDGIDTVLLRPVAWVYRTLVPDPAIFAIRRAVANLHAPVLFANDLLQADLEDAAVTAGRFAVNSTAGLLGLFDVAADIGLPAHHADFGQTLHSYGIGPGPYVMLPLLGPSTLRDGIGRGVDVLLDPLTWLVPRPEAYYLAGAEVVVRREALLDPLDELKASAIDYYGALRSAYYQTRAVELRKGRAALETGAPDADALFDAAE